ncbi:MAG: HK97 gp10 family phage protein [Thiobacillus sp.]
MSITGEIKGDREVVADLRRFDAAARGEIQKGIGRITLKLLTRVKAQKLSGQALNVRTGRLRRSITQRIESGAEEISGIVGTNVDYAAAHEYGFKGAVTVKQHLRKLRTASKFALRKVGGKDIGVYEKKQGKLTGGIATVKSHTRNINLPERSFLRSALADLKASGVIETEIDKAIARAIEAQR